MATACALPGSPAAELARLPHGRVKQVRVEHPTGEMTVVLTTGREGEVESAAILRTARKLFDGTVFAD